MLIAFFSFTRISIFLEIAFGNVSLFTKAKKLTMTLSTRQFL
jgi:hypothetical protein